MGFFSRKNESNIDKLKSKIYQAEAKQYNTSKKFNTYYTPILTLLKQNQQLAVIEKEKEEYAKQIKKIESELDICKKEIIKIIKLEAERYDITDEKGNEINEIILSQMTLAELLNAFLPIVKDMEIDIPEKDRVELNKE